MAYLQLGDQKFPLKAGPQRIGPEGTGADILLPSGAPTATAVVTVNADQTVIIQRATPQSVVQVNQVALGAEPSPLIHGDHVGLGGHDLRFGDALQAGNTQFISGADLADLAKARQMLPSKPTMATGGRLVSLVDGREYTVAPAGLTIGRDPAVDVVVPATEVSRKHVRIAPAEQGYVLSDLSTNGVWINGARVPKEQVLGRGDVIRIANEEFRFYADTVSTVGNAAANAAAAAAAAAAVAVAAEPPVMTPAAPVTPVPEVPPPVAQAAVAARAAASRTPLAVLELLNEGPDKGKRTEVFGPLTNIGRGAHNDLVLDNESVSDSHAKLQKRDAGWFIVDIDSTNGTYVGGRRIAGTQMLAGAPDLRFGDVKVAFKPNVTDADAGKHTRAIVGVSIDEAKRIAARRATPPGSAGAAAPAPVPAQALPSVSSSPIAELPVPARDAISPADPAATPVQRSGPTFVILLLVVAILAAVGYYLFSGA